MALKHYRSVILLVSLFFIGVTQAFAQTTDNNFNSIFGQDLNRFSPTKLKLSELERTPTILSGTLSSELADFVVPSSRFLPLVDLEVNSIVSVTLASEDIDTRMVLIQESDKGSEVILESNSYLPDTTEAKLSFLVEEDASYVLGLTGSGVGDYSIQVREDNSIPEAQESFEAYPAEVYSIDSSWTLKIGSNFASGILNTLADYYRLPTFTGGEDITISIESQDFDTYIYLIDASNGTILKENNNFKNNFQNRMSSISFVAEADIEYLVKATSRVGNAETGSYELVLSDFFIEDIDNIAATELDLSDLNSLSLSDTLGPEIVDTPDLSSAYYALTDLAIGSIVTVTLDSEDFDTYMFLIQEGDDRASSEVIMDTIDKEYSEESNESQISFLVEEGVSYVMEATSYFSDWSGKFSIDVTTGEAISEEFESFETYSIERYPGDKYINADFFDLTQGSSTEGELDRGPDAFINEVEFLANYYKLPTFTGGEELTVSVESDAFDTYIYLIDATNGAYVAENDDFEDNYQMSSLNFIVAADTEYLVKVTTAYAYGWGSYELVASTK